MARLATAVAEFALLAATPSVAQDDTNLAQQLANPISALISASF